MTEKELSLQEDLDYWRNLSNHLSDQFWSLSNGVDELLARNEEYRQRIAELEKDTTLNRLTKTLANHWKAFQ